MIQAQNICFHYKYGNAILRNISFELEQGHFLAILGNNGVGKSTLMKCFTNILNADSGKFLLNGEDLFCMSRQKMARHIAFVSQTVTAPQMTVRDVVLLGRKPYMRWGLTSEDYTIAHGAMARLNLLHMQEKFLHQLSGGERQKVMLARALAQQPQVLLLDEPTSSLDIKNQHQVLKTVRELCEKDGLTAIVVIHDLSLALRFCDRFLLLSDGQVYRYGDYDILTPEALQDVYGINGEIITVENQPLVLVKEFYN